MVRPTDQETAIEKVAYSQLPRGGGTGKHQGPKEPERKRGKHEQKPSLWFLEEEVGKAR